MAAGRHILLVEDDAELCLAVNRQLDDLGWEAAVATTGQEAIALLRQDLRVDVLLTEVRLPDMDGRDLAWAVCQKRPFARVAFMGLAAPDEALDPREAPFLRKPFTLTALSEALGSAAPLRRSSR